MTTPLTKRIESIDVIRGMAMVLMALDHIRDFLHVDAFVDDPLNLETTTPTLFATRWITHVCASIFVFLSGTSIYLQSQRKSSNELGIFLLKRGIWLIVAELTVLSFAWTFDPAFSFLPFQVIWAIGVSMLILGLIVLVKLPYKAIFAIGIVLVAGHNLFDFPEAAEGFQPNFWWDLLHSGNFASYQIFSGHFAVLIYPFPAWTGVMMLGYCFGKLFTSEYSIKQRNSILMRIGWSLILFFVALRFTNAYGNPVDWTVQKNGIYTFFSFIDVHKYPPSLLYLCITIGPSLLLLASVEKMKNRFLDAMVVFGRTAFFYYIIHLYLIHSIAMICFFARGHSLAEAQELIQSVPFYFVVPGEGFSLAIVYLFWIGIVALLYPLCRWYDRYKTIRREKWWLSYF